MPYPAEIPLTRAWKSSCRSCDVPAVIVAAHPDDEVLGAGTLLPVFPERITLVHVTNGAPRSGADARNAGCTTWQKYAALRRRELDQALAAVGVPVAVTLSLDCPDQQGVLRTADHIERFVEIFSHVRPSMVFTHAYEGGHPDHDSAAAAVHAARWLLKKTFMIVEFTGYHAISDAMECDCFLEGPPRADARPLSESQRRWKRGVLDFFASQARVLAQFPLRYEPLRIAPEYDFAQPPHSGQLYYERFEWAEEPAKWRSLTREAFASLGVPCVC